MIPEGEALGRRLLDIANKLGSNNLAVTGQYFTSFHQSDVMSTSALF